MRRSSRDLERCRRIKVNGTDLPYLVMRREVKYPRLEFKTGKLLAIIPKTWKDETPLLERKIGWISKKHGEIQGAIKKFEAIRGNERELLIFGNFFQVQKSGGVEINYDGNVVKCDLNDQRQLRRLRDLLKKRLLQELETAALEYSGKFGVSFNKIFVRRQRTKWASCSSRGNLSFNFLLVCLPRELIRYVVCHEMLHLEEKHHDKKFWERMVREFGSCGEMEKRLFEYWFLVQEYSRSSPLKFIV